MLEIKNPVTGKRIEVAINDCEQQLELDQAKKYCERIGNNWRLPKIDELELMHKELYNAGKGNFKSEFALAGDYWSDNEYSELSQFSEDDGFVGAWFFNFKSGEGYADCSSHPFTKRWVRAVRNL